MPRQGNNKINSEDKLYITPFSEEGGVRKAAASIGKKPAARGQFVSRAANLLFYFVILSVVLCAVLFSQRDKARSLFGYTYFTVLTRSMQSEIPQGSLVIVQDVERSTISVGDDITYLRSDSSTVTHRVVDVIENYNDSGARGFRTKGLENPEPDKEIIYANNVIGVVRVCIPKVGDVLTYVGDNLWMLFIILGALFILSFTLPYSIKKGQKPPATPKASAYRRVSHR